MCISESGVCGFVAAGAEKEVVRDDEGERELVRSASFEEAGFRVEGLGDWLGESEKLVVCFCPSVDGGDGA